MPKKGSRAPGAFSSTSFLFFRGLPFNSSQLVSKFVKIVKQKRHPTCRFETLGTVTREVDAYVPGIYWSHRPCARDAMSSRGVSGQPRVS